MNFFAGLSRLCKQPGRWGREGGAQYRKVSRDCQSGWESSVASRPCRDRRCGAYITCSSRSPRRPEAESKLGVRTHAPALTAGAPQLNNRTTDKGVTQCWGIPLGVTYSAGH